MSGGTYGGSVPLEDWPVNKYSTHAIARMASIIRVILAGDAPVVPIWNVLSDIPDDIRYPPFKVADAIVKRGWAMWSRLTDPDSSQYVEHIHRSLKIDIWPAPRGRGDFYTVMFQCWRIDLPRGERRVFSPEDEPPNYNDQY